MTIIMDGKALGKQITDNLKHRINNEQIKAGLAVVLVGDDPASKVYVNSKIKKCQDIGIKSFAHILPADTTQDHLLNLIADLNQNPDVHGILVQLPLPKHIDTNKIIHAINPSKDIDGFHPENVGKLHAGLEGGFIPCTPKGCIKLLKHYMNEPLTGKHAVVLGRSHMVGKPVAGLLLNESCTVTVVHSKTQNAPEIIHKADILVAAIGKPRFVKAEWVKQGVIIVDVGINRLADGLLVGDVDYNHIVSKAAAITPVPGGVGPMTIACLMENCVEANIHQHKITGYSTKQTYL